MRENGISIIFQDPIASLNPVFTIGNQMREVIRYSGIDGATDKNVQTERTIAALKETSMPDPERIMESYPFLPISTFRWHAPENMYSDVIVDAKRFSNRRRTDDKSRCYYPRSSSENSQSAS